MIEVLSVDLDCFILNGTISVDFDQFVVYNSKNITDRTWNILKNNKNNKILKKNNVTSFFLNVDLIYYK